MRKLISVFAAAMLLAASCAATADAFSFPEPDWGALLREKTNMVKAEDFELYVEGDVENAPFYGAKFEPRGGTYIGIAADDNAYDFAPVAGYLTYLQNYDLCDLYYPSNFMIMQDDVIAMVGWTIDTLYNIDYDFIDQTLSTLNSYNKPMLIRFANEMNCSELGDDPDLYIEVFRNVANIIHKYPNLAVVWSPNDLGALDRPFEYFYPGDEYVDWIGVSCYMKKYFQNDPNTDYKASVYFMTGDFAWATNKIKPIIEFMEKYGIQKPLMLSECGVTTNNLLGDSDESIVSWNIPRMRNLYWNLIMKYPQIKMINYFNSHRFYESERFNISGDPKDGIKSYSYAEDILKEAIASGAYIRSYGGAPEFVYTKAEESDTLTARDGVVPLYTLAYLPQKPNIYVTYRVDGSWVHTADQIPYTCNLDINSISDGMHTLSIETAGNSKSYTFYKDGQFMSFGQMPDIPDSISIYMNGSQRQKLFLDQPPVVVDGRTLVPVRAIFDAMGLYVDWNDVKRTVAAWGGSTYISLVIGEDTLHAKTASGSKDITLDVPAQIIGGRTLVPLRAIAEACGADVDWNEAAKTITISDWSV